MAYKDHHLPNNYNKIKDLLSPYLDGEVTEEEKAVVEAELAVSVELRKELETLRRTINLVSSLPPVTAPRPFTLSEADVKPLRPAPRPGGYFGLPGWLGGLAALATVLVCVAAVGFFLMTQQFGTSSRPGAAGEIAKVPTPVAPQAMEREAQQEMAPAEPAAPQVEIATAETRPETAEDTALLAEEAPQPAEAPAAKAGPEEGVETFGMAQENAAETGAGQVPLPPPAPTLAAPAAPDLPQAIEEAAPAEEPAAPPPQEDRPVTGLAAEESHAAAEAPIAETAPPEEAAPAEEAMPAEEPAAEKAPLAPPVEETQPPEVAEKVVPGPPQEDQTVMTKTAEATPPPAAPEAPQENAPVEESAAQAVPPLEATVETPAATVVEDHADARGMEEAAPAPPPTTGMGEESLRTEIMEAPAGEGPGDEERAFVAPPEQAAATAPPETAEVAPEQEIVEEAAPPVEPLPGPHAPEMAVPPPAGQEPSGAPRETQPVEQPAPVEPEAPEVAATPVPVPATVVPITATPTPPLVTTTAAPSPTTVAQLTATPTPQVAAATAVFPIEQEEAVAAPESSTWLLYIAAVVVVGVLAIIGLVVIRFFTQRR